MIYGVENPRFVLIQPADEHDLEGMGQEAAYLRAQGCDDFLLAPVPVADWNRNLSPWPAPPVFGREAFGDGAAALLSQIRQSVLTDIQKDCAPAADARLIIGGYSLAGLFALWCGHETGLFHGVAAASPSVWFPGFLDYAGERPLQARAVYLSLGDREEKTRNAVMARVGDCIRSLHERYASLPGVKTALAWNPGNHFMDAAIRTAKAFCWVMDALN